MSELPLMDTNDRDFNEVKKHLHDNDSAWIRQQFGLRRLSPNFRLSRAFPPNVHSQSLLSYSICEKLSVMAFEVAKLCSRSELNSQDRVGVSALMHAAYWGQSQLVLLLLDLRADPGLKASEEKFRRTALDMARSYLHTDTAALLEEYMHLETEERRKAFLTPRLEPARYHLEVLAHIEAKEEDWVASEVDSGRLPVDYMLSRDKSLLFCSVEQNSRKVVQALLNRGADANDTDEYNHSVLHAAAANQNLEIFRLLLIYGACYKTYAEAGEASPEFTCMEMENTILPSYAASWLSMREDQRRVETAKYAPELADHEKERRARLVAMTREELYEEIEHLRARVKELESFQLEHKRAKRLHHDITGAC